MDDVKQWIEAAPYCRALGLELDAIDPAHAMLRLPYSDANSNPGKALHGGCAASIGAIAGHALTRAALGVEAVPLHTAQMQVSYLAAAIGEDVIAEARLLRKGRALCFVGVDVHTTEGKPIARITTTVCGRFGDASQAYAISARDHGESEPGPMGASIGLIPFIDRRGIRVEHMTAGRSRLVMPHRAENEDAEGGIHEGAVLALLDTTGAMAAWAEAGVGRKKASTPSLQMQIYGPTAASDLVAYGRAVQRVGDVFWSDVEVADARTGRVSARGTVFYRIVNE